MSETNQEFKLHALDYWQVLRNRYGVILLVFCLVFLTATVITYLMPKEYLGRSTVEINKQSKGKIGQANVEYEPYHTFMQTQFALIESKENLDLVIDELGLVSAWGLHSGQEAYNRLVRKLKTRDRKGTDLVDIEVYDPDPELAAKLANHIAESYKNRREMIDRERRKKNVRELEMQAHKQDRLLAEARAEMSRLREANHIVDTGLRPGGDNPDGGGTGEIVRSSKMRLHEVKREIATLGTTIERLTALHPDELIGTAVQLGVDSPTLISRYPEYQSALIQRERLLKSGLGPAHPRVIETDGVVSLPEGLLEDAVVSAKQAMRTQLSLKQAELENMERLTEEVEGELVAEREGGVGYIAARDEYELRRELLAGLHERIALANVDDGVSEDHIVVHGAAEPPTFPAKPNVNLQLGIGAVLGLAFGVGLAFFLEYLDTSVKSLEDVERYLKVPVLAVVPRDVGILHRQSGMSPDAEAYRILRTNIEFNRSSADANSITIVSGGAGEGKSTTLVNLAYICAQGGYATLMIDGDLRRPKLHTFFDINNSIGLTNYLTTELELEDVILQTPVDNLFFMPSGILPADAAGILNSRRMSELISEVKGRFDLVLVDSPPILGVSDGSVLASEVDLTMIVIQHRKLPRNMLVRVKQAVENVGGNLLGVVLNNVDVRSDSQYQYYTSYYTYYAPAGAGVSRNGRGGREIDAPVPAESPREVI